jgi:glycosyltransferase involved in cell wall biosynthesis
MERIIFIAGVRFHIPKIVASLRNKYNIKIISTVPRRFFKLNKNEKYTFIPMLFKILSKIMGYKSFEFEKKIDNTIFRYLSKFVKVEKCDILYSCSSYAHDIFLKSNKNLKILDVANIHVMDAEILLKNEYAKFNIKYKLNQFIKKIQLQEYRLADKIIVPSHRSYLSFINNNIDKSKLVKGFFIQLNQEPSFKKKLKIGNNIKLGYIGGNVVIKGLFYLLKALQNTSNTNLTLNLCLPYSYIEENTFLRQEYNEKIMSCLGFTDNMDKFYSSIDYLVVPSISDGFAQVVIESLSRNIPVICSDAVGSSEYLDINYGHIFESQSVMQLTNILDKINVNELNSKITSISHNINFLKKKIEDDQKEIIEILKKNH